MAQMLPSSAVYHIGFTAKILPPLDVAALRSALRAIVDRHDSLRTVFAMDAAGKLMQTVYADSPVEFTVVDTTGFSAGELDAAVNAAYRHPFDLESGPLFRPQLFTGNGEYLLLLTVHHLVFDSLSMVLVLSELEELYGAIQSGKASSLRPTKGEYRDFVDWQNQMLAGPEGAGQLAFWRAQLEGAPPILDFPLDRPRPLHSSGLGDSVVFSLESDLVQRLKALAVDRKVRPIDILAAAWHILLHRYSSQNDILIGFVTGGRPLLQFARTTGFYSNTIVLRAHFDDDPAFDDFLQGQHATLARGLENQNYPFPLVAEALQGVRVPGYMPLIQAVFNHYKIPRNSHLTNVFTGHQAEPLESEALALRPVRLKQDDIEFDLSLDLAEAERYWARIRFSADLFEHNTIERLTRHYVNVLQAVAANPSQTVSSIPLLAEAEREEILSRWNRQNADVPAGATACRLFEEQAAATPDRIAVVCGNRRLTYAELNARAESLAARLRESGAVRGSLVGVCVDRSIDMLAALLATWKAGVAYVPLDPHFPKARLDMIVDDAKPRTILTETALAGLLTPSSATVILVDADGDPPSSAYTPDSVSAPPGSDLAYVLYTSGSTGQPKGVEIPHSALTNFLLSMRKCPGIEQNDVLLAVTTFSFDISGLELFLPLIAGATVVIATHEITHDGRQLAREIETLGVTLMQATPATWRLLIDSDWPGCSRLKALCGGEALPAELAEKLLPRVASLWNMYGPTETTIWSAVHEVAAGNDPIPLGSPIDNTTLYILDRNLQPVPIGVAGELHIGGAGVARGYRNRPDLTAEKFIEHPFRPGERLYKTGDLCRHRADGSILFLGRLDDQVKLRGRRIELGEIESMLLRHSSVHEAAVVINEDPGGPKRLVAYLIAPADVPPAPPESLREFLSTHLPDFMIPSAFVYLDSLPLTPNAKVDRKALRSLTVAPAAGEREYATPRTARETAIAALWQEMLQARRVGIHDRFDELGGDSLSFALMTIRAGKLLGIKIPVRMDGDMLSVAGFARAADAIASEAAPPPSPAPASSTAHSVRTGFSRPEPLTKTWHGQLLIKTCSAIVRSVASIAVEGLENMPANGPVIVASNHISLFDFVILGATFGSGALRLPMTVTFIIADKWRWLAQPYASQLGDTIYIRRGRGDAEALQAAMDVLANHGAIAMMPEGRPTRGALTRAKPGVAYLACETGAPVWPVAIFGHDRALDFWKRLRRVPVSIRLGKRIVPNRGDSRDREFQRQADGVMKEIAAMMPREYHGVYPGGTNGDSR